MLARSSHPGTWLTLTLIAVAAAAACGGGGKNASSLTGNGGGASSGTGNNGGGSLTLSNGTGNNCNGLDVQPATPQTIVVAAGQTTPTVTYHATLNCVPASAGWSVDKGNVGAVPAGPSQTAVFTPTGKAGGMVTVTAGLNGKTVARQVMVQLTAQQNGGDPMNPAEMGQIPSGIPALTAGGGVGGVGGEGLGTTVTDPATLKALGMPAGDGKAQGLAFLYPYDQTVWPRGLLAPLLMWTWSTGDADAIRIDMKTTTGSFLYTGTFGRPAILQQTKGPFIRMPIPQDVWDMATNTAGGKGDQLKVSLTVAKGGVAYGPISETWTIAPAHLSGTIYYNSYGTQLVQNYGGAVGGNGMFGAAVLAIHVGDPAPKVVAGTNTDCRTCHSVAAFGSRLVAMPYGNYSAYDLVPNGPSVEHVMPNSGAWFPGLYPDGSKMLTADGQLLALPNGGAAIPTTGLAGVVTDLGTPMFSPDGSRIAFNPHTGGGVMPDQTLYVMSYDSATNAFGGLKLIAQETAPVMAGWPAFFPDSKSVVYHRQTATSMEPGDIIVTRAGSRAQIYWTSLNGPMDSTPLDRLNGKGYLPKLPGPVSLACSADGIAVGGIDADHPDDVDLNYEPTANPIASGGYAWVVFTSRRLYGNEAAIPPFCSDPRGVDLIQNITPKKLWVAAIDLTQGPGTDASHPAFYLPAQELLAGNSRGFWVLDPCKADGMSCTSGDQCCNGYCEPNGPMGALVCSNKAPGNTCSGVGDKCSSVADCCDPTNVCINGFCTIKNPQ
jgi:hypothetical protein